MTERSSSDITSNPNFHYWTILWNELYKDEFENVTMTSCKRNFSEIYNLLQISKTDWHPLTLIERIKFTAYELAHYTARVSLQS